MSSKINNIYGETPKIKKKTRSKMKEERVEYDKEEEVENKYVNSNSITGSFCSNGIKFVK